MTVSPEPQPSPRIGDAERDDAVSLLQEHMAAGRLDSTEFNDRMNTALQARTMGDLTPLFTDLPGRRPGQQVAVPEPKAVVPEAATPPKSDVVMKRIGTIVISLLWPAAILASIATGFTHWWIWLIPVFGSGVIAKAFGLVGNDDDHRRDRLQHHHDHHQLRIEQRIDRMDQRLNRRRDRDDE